MLSTSSKWTMVLLLLVPSAFSVFGGSEAVATSESSINLTCTVVENAKLDGTPICSIRDELLRRGEIQPGMQLRYELVPVSNVDVNDVWQLLDLNPSTGLISLARRRSAESLDRERTPVFEFIVFVDNARSTSGASARQTTPSIIAKLQQSIVVNVRLLVLDENDNAPVWTHSNIRLNFTESDPRNSSRFFQLAADRDSGTNAAIMYRKQRVHAVYPNGSVVQLDESQEPFRFSVARSGPESIARRDAHTGMLSLLQQLDAETDATEYKFDLVAIDRNGSPVGSLSSTATVVVVINDVNEFAPVFVSSFNEAVTTYSINVSEAHPINVPILTVRSVDSDRSASAITYSLATSPDGQQTDESIGQFVAIDEQTGEVFLKERLNFETLGDDAATKRIFVPIYAIDNGFPSKLTSSATVTINVIDENDNAPEIRISCGEEATLTIVENADLTTNSETDCRVTAIDADSGVFGQVYCTVGQSASAHFGLSEQHVNRRTPIYRVKVLHSFDYEAVRRLDVPIECWDGAGRSSTSMLNVVIGDVNDCAPEFTQPNYSATVNENSEPDTFVTQVRAIDRDTVTAERVVYEIVQQTIVAASGSGAATASPATARLQTERPLFAIDDRGSIRVVGALDRERFDRVVLLLRAIDGSNSSLFSTAVVTVSLLDVNDNQPSTKRVHTFAAVEDAPVGTLLGTIFVSDADASSSQRLTYELATADCASLLRIEDASGELRTIALLDRESRSHYLCRIDIGDGIFSTHTLVNVTIIDTNDNAPLFTFPSRSNATVRVKSMPNPGDLLAKANAVDADVGPNGIVRYSLQHPSDLFEIGETTGELKLKRTLQTNDGLRKALLIVATDQGDPQKSSTGVLTILIDQSVMQNGDGDSEKSQQEDAHGISQQTGRFLFSDGMMNILVTVSLVAVSACLLATLLVVLFLIWKRYMKLDHSRRRCRERKRMVNGSAGASHHTQQHQHQHGAAARPVSLIGSRALFPDQNGSSSQRGKAHLSVTMLGDLLSDAVSSSSSVNDIATMQRLCSANGDNDTSQVLCVASERPRPHSRTALIPQSRSDTSLCQNTIDLTKSPSDCYVPLIGSRHGTISGGSEALPSVHAAVVPPGTAKSWRRTVQDNRKICTPLPFHHRAGSGSNCPLGHALSAASGRNSVYGTLPCNQRRDEVSIPVGFNAGKAPNSERRSNSKSKINGDAHPHPNPSCNGSLLHLQSQADQESSFKPIGQRPGNVLRYADLLDGANLQNAQNASVECAPHLHSDALNEECSSSSPTPQCHDQD